MITTVLASFGALVIASLNIWLMYRTMRDVCIDSNASDLSKTVVYCGTLAACVGVCAGLAAMLSAGGK